MISSLPSLPAETRRHRAILDRPRPRQVDSRNSRPTPPLSCMLYTALNPPNEIWQIHSKSACALPRSCNTSTHPSPLPRKPPTMPSRTEIWTRIYTRAFSSNWNGWDDPLISKYSLLISSLEQHERPRKYNVLSRAPLRHVTA